MAQWLRLHEEKVKICVACGAASGIADTFNAPIAGVMFAQEVILGQFTSITFIPIVISSVTASVIARALDGDKPAFVVQQYNLNSPVELAFYVGLGILAALVSYLFVKILYKTEDIIDEVKIIPEWLKPVFGGLAIGLIGLKFPQILGVGYETIESTFSGELVLGTMAALILAKILATSLTLGSGHSGGVFAPSLFIGATLGGTVGLALKQFFPGMIANPGAYAVVGMGAVVAGTTQAPITAIMIIFEMTRDYRLILPLMIAVVLSTLIYSMLSNSSIYTMKLARRGVVLQSGKDINVMKEIKVSQVMSTPVETVYNSDKVATVIAMMHHSKHNGFPVLNKQNELTGIITLLDIRNAPVETIMEIPVSQLMSTILTVTYANETIDDVFIKMKQFDIGHLPVVNRQNPKELIGIITRSDIIKAYDQGLLGKQTEKAHNA